MSVEYPPHYQRLLAGYADPARLGEVVAADVVYTIHGDATLSGTYRGVAGMAEWIALANRLSGGTARFTPDVLLADEETVLTYGTVTARRGGEAHRIGHIYYLRWAGGLLVEGHTFAADPEPFNRLWSV